MLRFSRLFFAPKITLSCKPDAFVNVKAQSCPVVVKAVDVIEHVNSDLAIIHAIDKTDAEFDESLKSKNGTAEVLIEGHEPIKFENCSKIVVESPIFTRNLQVRTCGKHDTEISGLDAGKILMEMGPKVVPGQTLPIVEPVKCLLKSLKANRGVQVVSEKYPVDLETKGSITCNRLTLNLFHQDSDITTNGQVSVLDLDMIAGKIEGNKSIYTERGSINSTRTDTICELLQVRNTLGAGSVRDMKIKVVEGAGEIVLNAKRMMDVWLSDTCKNVTLRCNPQMRVNFSEKLPGKIELDSNALEEPGPKVFAQTIQNQSKNEKDEIVGLIMTKEQREIPHVRRRFQIDLKNESTQRDFEHLDTTTPAKIKLVSDNFTARILGWSPASIRKYAELDDNLKSMMRDWSINQDLNNQQPRHVDLGAKRHKEANPKVFSKTGATKVIPGKFQTEEEMQEITDSLASKVLPPKKEEKLIE